jgi:hypothetical protein
LCVKGACSSISLKNQALGKNYTIKLMDMLEIIVLKKKFDLGYPSVIAINITDS